MRVVRSLLLLLAVAAAPCFAGDWPRFRGPDGTGVTDDTSLPTEWSVDRNIVWKTPLPKSDAVCSSPIVVGARIYITYGIAKPVENHVLCISRVDGKILWDTSIDPGPAKTADNRAGFAGPTPCSDGMYVYATFASAVIAGLDLDGKVIWRKELPNHQFDVVMGNSPVLYGDTVILINDQNGGKSQFLAFDKITGDVGVDQPRPGCGFAHSTPISAKIAGQDQLIAAASKALQGIDPATGKVLWFCNFDGGETASPAYDGSLVYFDGGRGNPGISVQPGGTGDVTKQAFKAKFTAKSDLGSPVVLGDYVYRQVGDDLACMRLATGETIYKKTVKGTGGWASPFASRDGKVYVGTSDVCVVYKAGPEGEVIATNRLGDPSNASAAVADGRIYFRGTKYLWCIGK